MFVFDYSFAVIVGVRATNPHPHSNQQFELTTAYDPYLPLKRHFSALCHQPRDMKGVSPPSHRRQLIVQLEIASIVHDGVAWV